MKSCLIRNYNMLIKIKNWGNFYKKYKILGGFHKIKDQMLISMTLYIFRGTSPSSGVQMYTAFYISYKNFTNFLLNMFHLEPTPLSLNKINVQLSN